MNPPSAEKLKVSDSIYPFARAENSLYYGDGEELVLFVNSVEQWRVIVGPMRQIVIVDERVVVFGDNALWEVTHAKITKTKVLEANYRLSDQPAILPVGLTIKLPDIEQTPRVETMIHLWD